MSIRWMSAVIHRYQGPPARKLILMALADCASDSDGRAWPSYAYLATAANVSRDTAKRHVRSLVDEGCITLCPRPSQASIYLLQPSETWGQNAPGAKCTGGTAVHRGGVHSCAPGGGAQLCPPNRHRTVIEPESARAPDATPPGADPQERGQDLEAAAEAYLDRLRSHGALYVDADRAAWLKARTDHGADLVLRALDRTSDPRIGPVLRTCADMGSSEAEEERIAKFHAAQAAQAQRAESFRRDRADLAQRHRRTALALVAAIDRADPPPPIDDQHRAQLADLRQRLRSPDAIIPPMWAMYRWPVAEWIGHTIDDLHRGANRG